MYYRHFKRGMHLTILFSIIKEYSADTDNKIYFEMNLLLTYIRA
jgi:hypothetical protein